MSEAAPSVPHFWGTLLKLARPFLALLLVAGLFSLHPDFRGTFWTAAYLPNVVQQSARNIVLAVGLSFVILTGGIDLGVGSVLALAGVAAATALRGDVPDWLAWVAGVPASAAATCLLARRAAPPVRWVVFALAAASCGVGLSAILRSGVRTELAVIFAILVGLACGMLNGWVVAVGRVPAFVATLGMLTAARGMTLYATGGSSVPVTAPRFLQLGQGWPLALITVGVVAAGAVLVGASLSGRAILAVGSSPRAARLSGLDVAGTRLLAYSLSGVCAAIGALLVTAKFGTADTNAGTGAELDAIAAVVIGGASLSGGRGSIVGALVGALTITVVQSGLVLIGIQDSLQPVILGGVIVATVFVDQIRARGGRDDA